MHVENTHPPPRGLTSPTHTSLSVWDKPLITSRTWGKKKKPGERYSCNFLPVVSSSLFDGSWQNWDCSTNTRRPSTYESKLCCTISLLSDFVSGLFKIHVKSGAGAVLEARQSWKTLIVAEGCGARTCSLWLQDRKCYLSSFSSCDKKRVDSGLETRCFYLLLFTETSRYRFFTPVWPVLCSVRSALLYKCTSVSSNMKKNGKYSIKCYRI